MNSNLKLLTNTLTLGSGAASAQFLGVLAVPVLARVFNANDFGVFAMFFLGSQLLGTCFAARYEQAIMVAEERHVSALTALCVSLAIVSALASALVLTLFARELDLIFNTSLGLAWPLTSIAAFFVSITTTFTMVASRRQSYGGISVSRFCKAMVAILIQAALGLTILPNAWGLIIGETFASSVGAALLLSARRWSCLSDLRLNVFEPRQRRPLLLVALRHQSFPKFSLPQFLINSLSGFVLIVIIVGFFSSTEAGQYFMMQRIVTIPAGIISIAVAQILYVEAHQLVQKTGRFDGAVMRVLILQMLLGAILFFVLLLFGVQMFSFVLGSQWAPSGHLAELFAPYVAVHLVLSALAPVPVIARQQRMALILSIVQNAIFVGGFFIPTWFGMSLERSVSVSVYVSMPYMISLIVLFFVVSRTPRPFSVARDHFSGAEGSGR
ncbi:oligosaccharide flippase family protein [Mesorhizobium sp. L-2-11]|uniref:oligosaccharide flippase family protein n=1 Tax=Mesorhizobium sp. L-2-11 TaxID=2744521 RepID=UPI001929185A|nr:oligosaccharide flippase family protein [Mesorhizobium sp. L-2-11]